MTLRKDIFMPVLDSLNIFKYGKLKERPLRFPIGHFFLVLFLSVVISGIIYVPTVISFSNSVKESLGNFEQFTLNPSIETSEPAIIWSDDFLVFDTTGNMSANASRFYVDGDYFYYDHGEKARDLAKAGDLTDNSELLGNLILYLAFILLPSFLMTYFIVSFFLLATIILLTVTAIWAITRFPRKKKHKTSFRGILVSCLYASTILAIALLVNSIISGVGSYLIIVFLIYSFLGTIQKTHDHDDQHAKKRTKKKSSGDDE